MRFRRFVLALVIGFAVLLTPAISAGSTYRVLYNFYGNYGLGGPNGGPPLAAPVLDTRGNLYGTAGGGVGNSSHCSGPCGVVFKMTRGANGKWTESVALNFSTYFDLGSPNSPVAFDNRGNLYGSIRGGIGINWVFQLTPARGGWGFNLIYQNYDNDVGGVISDNAGNLYGNLGRGLDYLGAIGKLSRGSSGWVYADLHDLCDKNGNCPGGDDPQAPLSWDAGGNLYGTDYAGGLPCPGTYGCGVAFQMTPNSQGTPTYHVLHLFGAFKGDGLYPWGGLVVDKSGAAYGTTIGGGPYGFGEVFKLTPSSGSGWIESVLYGFPNVKLGAFPWGNLVFDKSGNLYGVANGGNTCGNYFCGEVFKLSPQRSGQWKYSVVHGFKGPDGAYPYGVVIDESGHLFGTAWGGGTYNYGVVFEISP
jgi:uncharacterized repeat protein (TIGR03803 family)